MSEKIMLQEVWSPPGKEFPKVITTPEKKKYHLYEDQAELAEHIKVGDEIEIDAFETTNRAGKPINRIQNIYVDGKPVIAQEPTEKKAPLAKPTGDKYGEGQREGMCWKEIGELFRTDKMITLFGKENAKEIARQYRTYLLGTLKLTFDGAKLPQWKDKP